MMPEKIKIYAVKKRRRRGKAWRELLHQVRLAMFAPESSMRPSGPKIADNSTISMTMLTRAAAWCLWCHHQEASEWWLGPQEFCQKPQAAPHMGTVDIPSEKPVDYAFYILNRDGCNWGLVALIWGFRYAVSRLKDNWVSWFIDSILAESNPTDHFTTRVAWLYWIKHSAQFCQKYAFYSSCTKCNGSNVTVMKNQISLPVDLWLNHLVALFEAVS